jgi:hypothetical protein
LNVKSFKIPHLINKIAYAWLRGSKAKYSYESETESLNKSGNYLGQECVQVCL